MLSSSWCKPSEWIGALQRKTRWCRLLDTTRWVQQCLVCTVQQSTNRGHHNAPICITFHIVTVTACPLRRHSWQMLFCSARWNPGFVITAPFLLLGAEKAKGKVFRGVLERSDLMWRLLMYALLYTSHLAIWSSAASEPQYWSVSRSVHAKTGSRCSFLLVGDLKNEQEEKKHNMAQIKVVWWTFKEAPRCQI